MNKSKLVGFDWDIGNERKNWEKHFVAKSECEEVFFNSPLFVIESETSGIEQRWFVLGTTDEGRLLFIVFTVRKDKIRIISARDMHRSERKLYEKKASEI